MTSAHDRVMEPDAAAPTEPPTLAALAQQQGVSPVTKIAELRITFWPEDETDEDLVAAIREWRRSGERHSAGNK